MIRICPTRECFIPFDHVPLWARNHACSDVTAGADDDAMFGNFGYRENRGEDLMNAFLKRAKHFLQSEDGPTATEYAVMLALIIVIAMGAIGTIGTTVTQAYTDLNTGLVAAGVGAS